MAGKITDYNPLTSGFALTDLLELVDVSDTTLSVNGSNKKVTLGNLLANLPGATDAVSLGLSGASLTGSNASSFVDLAGTWNTTGTPTAIKLNVTDTASNAESLLMDLQTGGTSRCAVLKSGSIRLRFYEGIGNDGSQGSKWTFNNGSAVLGKWDSTDYLKVAFNANTTTLHADHALCWGSSAVSSEDVFLYRDAAAVLALRNSTNAQAFRVYNTYTDGSNNEYGRFGWNSNILDVGPVANGSGTLRQMRLLGSQVLLDGDGTAAAPALAFDIGGNYAYGLWYSSGFLRFSVNGIQTAAIGPSGLYGNHSTTAYPKIQGFGRNVVGRTSDGSENGTSQMLLTTNAGATALVTRTLPSAIAGMAYDFYCADTDGIKISAATGDEIRVIDAVTATAGYIQSTTIGSYVHLVAVDSTTWVATSIQGVWTDGTWTYDDSGLTT